MFSLLGSRRASISLSRACKHQLQSVGVSWFLVRITSSTPLDCIIATVRARTDKGGASACFCGGRSMRGADRGRSMTTAMDGGGMAADKADMSEAEYVRMWEDYAAE